MGETEVARTVSTVSLRNRWWANRMDRKAWRLNGLRPSPWTFIL